MGGELVTVAILESDSQTQVVQQPLPRMQGVSLISYGNQGSGHGVTGTAIGNQTVGMSDGTLQQFSTLGLSRQYPYFESSASGGDDALVYALLGGATSPYSDKVDATMNCGNLTLTNYGLSSANLMAHILTAGRTLSTKTGWTQSLASGNVAVTGVGFQPQLILFTCFGLTSFSDPPPVPGVHSLLSVGAATGSSQWAFMASTTGWLSNPADRVSRASDSHVVISRDRAYVSLVSMDVDGFTLNWAGINDDYIEWMAFGDADGEFSVGMGVAGDASLGVGFVPECSLFVNSGVTLLDSNVAGASIGVGACDKSLTQYSGWGAGGAATKSATERRYWNNTATSMANNTTGAAVNTAEAAVTSMASGVTLNWTLGGGSGILFGWAAFRTSIGPDENCGPLGGFQRWG